MGLLETPPRWHATVYNHQNKVKIRLGEISTVPLKSLKPKTTLLSCKTIYFYFRVFLFHLGTQEFELIGESLFHDHCVLSVCHVITSANQGQPSTSTSNQKSCYISSAATDGKVAFWDISKLLQRHLSNKSRTSASGASYDTEPPSCDNSPSSKDVGAESSMQKSSLHSDSVDKHMSLSRSDLDLGSPVLVCQGHQSGVNAMDIGHISSNIFIEISHLLSITFYIGLYLDFYSIHVLFCFVLVGILGSSAEVLIKLVVPVVPLL